MLEHDEYQAPLIDSRERMWLYEVLSLEASRLRSEQPLYWEMDEVSLQLGRVIPWMLDGDGDSESLCSEGE